MPKETVTRSQPTQTKAAKPLTTGGIVPNDEGYQRIAEILATGIYGHHSRVTPANPALVHSAVKA